MQTKMKKINLSVILIVAFWVVSLALTVSLAWFTAKSNPLEGSLSFGTIKVAANIPGEEPLIKATAKNSIVEKVLPGDDLTIKFSAENIGTEHAWALAHLQITATIPAPEGEVGQPIYGFPIQSGLYPLKSINIDTQYTIPTDAEDFPIDAKVENVTYTVKIPTSTGNAFQGADIKVVVTIYAIQKRHMEAKEAYNEMAREAGYIIATPVNAQNILNSDINGKTVIFTDGTYSHLALEASKETISAIHNVVVVADKKGDGYDDIDIKTKGTEVSLSLIDNLPEAPGYFYTRNVNNVTFAATSGAKFTGMFTARTKLWQYYGYATDYELGIQSSTSYDTRLDPVRGLKTTDASAVFGHPGSNGFEVCDIAFYECINLKNIRFENMNFIGKNSRVFIGTDRADAIIDGITFANCSFNNANSEYYKSPNKISYAAIVIEPRGGGAPVDGKIYMNNITVANCKFNNHYQGVRVSNANNIIFENNTFSNLDHSAIYLQENVKVYTGGNILISANTYSNVANHPLSFYAVQNATILIKDEIYTNVTTAENQGQILKIIAGSSTSSITVANCYYDGVAVADVNAQAITDTSKTYKLTKEGIIF